MDERRDENVSPSECGTDIVRDQVVLDQRCRTCRTYMSYLTSQ